MLTLSWLCASDDLENAVALRGAIRFGGEAAVELLVDDELQLPVSEVGDACDGDFEGIAGHTDVPVEVAPVVQLSALSGQERVVGRGVDLGLYPPT